MTTLESLKTSNQADLTWRNESIVLKIQFSFWLLISWIFTNKIPLGVVLKNEFVDFVDSSNISFQNGLQFRPSKSAYYIHILEERSLFQYQTSGMSSLRPAKCKCLLLDLGAKTKARTRLLFSNTYRGTKCARVASIYKKYTQARAYMKCELL